MLWKTQKEEDWEIIRWGVEGLALPHDVALPSYALFTGIKSRVGKENTIFDSKRRSREPRGDTAEKKDHARGDLIPHRPKA